MNEIKEEQTKKYTIKLIRCRVDQLGEEIEDELLFALDTCCEIEHQLCICEAEDMLGVPLRRVIELLNDGTLLDGAPYPDQFITIRRILKFMFPEEMYDDRDAEQFEDEGGDGLALSS